MEAAYGLAISITMIMTTILFISLSLKERNYRRFAIIVLIVFLTIEGSFLIANLNKFKNGGWFTLLLATVYFLIMFGWYFGRKIKNRRISFSNISNYIGIYLMTCERTKRCQSIATNLVYIIKANRQDQVESKVMYSIFNKFPKRADRYWFLHVDRVDEPNRFDYKVNQIIPGVLIRIDFHIGFKMDTKINLYFREVLEDLVNSGEYKLESGYDSLKKYGFPGDFKYVLIERIMLKDIKLSSTESFIMNIHRLIDQLSIPAIKALELDRQTLLWNRCR